MGPRVDQDMCGNFSVPGFDPRTVKPVANRYTELTRLNYGRLSHAISLAVFFQFGKFFKPNMPFVILLKYACHYNTTSNITECQQ